MPRPFWRWLSAQGDAAAEELRILSWQGYADEDWVKEFEAETGADVNVVFIGTDDEIWAKIKGSEGKDFDLFAVNTAQLQRYIDLGLTTPYDMDMLPNQKETLERFRDLTKVAGTMRDGNVYGIPFAFDTIGIIYDTEKVKTPPTSWDVFYDDEYTGRILGYDNGEHNFSITALDMGIEDPFHLSEEQLQAAKAKLIDMKHNLLSLYSTPDEALQLYQQNDVAIIWANYGQQQVKAMLDAGAPIAYVNAEGGRARLARHLGDDERRQEQGARREVGQLHAEEGDQRRVVGAAGLRQHRGAVSERRRKRQDRLAGDGGGPDERADLWNEVKATP